MKTALLWGAVIMSVSTPAFADWYRVASGTSGAVWYMDPTRVKEANGKKLVWVKIDGSRDPSVKWRESKVYYSIDCDASKYRILAIVDYDSYGKVIDSNTFQDYGYGIGYNPVTPDSVLETVVNATCVL